MAYATYTQFTTVYSIQGITQGEIDGSGGWLDKASTELNARLGAFFTIPFSSNNSTATDLTVHMAYAAIGRRGPRNVAAPGTSGRSPLEAWIADYIKGLQDGMPMTITDGTFLYPTLGAENTFWSTTGGFKSTFDMRGPEKQRIDPQYLIDLDDQDLA